MKRTLLALLVLLAGAPPAFAQQPTTVVSETNGSVAGSPADAETNTEPFLARMGMRGYFFNGTTWDRMRGDTTSGLWVNVKNTTLAVTQASASVASGAYSSGAFASGAFASGSIAAGACADGCNVTLGAKTDAASTATNGTSTSVVSILKEISAMAQAPAALPANQSTNNAQRNGVALSSPDTNGYPPDGMAATALVNAGWVPKYVATAASTNSAFIKNAPGNVGGIFAQSTSATVMYVRFYDSASAPTCSSSTNFIGTVAVWPTSQTNGFMIPAGFQMVNGISYCITGGAANNDNTAATTGGMIWIFIK